MQELIQSGIDEGANLLVGGLGKPEGCNKNGFFARPTIFEGVTSDMRLWREEVFGPVLSISPFDDEEEGIRMANDTVYGLTSYLQTGSEKRAERVAGKLRAGMVEINFKPRSAKTPFGGVGQSGNGREVSRGGANKRMTVRVSLPSIIVA